MEETTKPAKRRLTYEGMKKLEDELADLKENKRREVAQKLKEAREQGDLSENAEYDAAKDEQRDVETRIAEIEEILRNSEVIEEENSSSDKITFGDVITFEDMATQEQYTYRLSGSTEANILDGSISDESPVGSKLKGAKKGMIFTVNARDGSFDYKILDFRRG